MYEKVPEWMKSTDRFMAVSKHKGKFAESFLPERPAEYRPNPASWAEVSFFKGELANKALIKRAAKWWRWRSNVPCVWGSFEDGIVFLKESNTYRHLAICLHSLPDDRGKVADRVMCLDIDAAFNEDKTLRPEVRDLLNAVESLSCRYWVEYSKSGRGLHIFIPIRGRVLKRRQSIYLKELNDEQQAILDERRMSRRVGERPPQDVHEDAAPRDSIKRPDKPDVGVASLDVIMEGYVVLTGKTFEDHDRDGDNTPTHEDIIELINGSLPETSETFELESGRKISNPAGLSVKDGLCEKSHEVFSLPDVAPNGQSRGIEDLLTNSPVAVPGNRNAQRLARAQELVNRFPGYSGPQYCEWLVAYPPQGIPEEHGEDKANRFGRYLTAEYWEEKVARVCTSRESGLHKSHGFEAVEEVVEPVKKLRCVPVRRSEMKKKNLDFLWPGRIAKGQVTIVGGVPGVGKSFFFMDLIGCVTTGKDFPDGAKNAAGPRNVIFCTKEEDFETNLPWRCDAAGVDPDRFVAMNQMSDGSYFDYSKPTHREALRELVEEEQAALVILDPLMSFAGGADSNEAETIRFLLEDMTAFCQETGVATLPVIHHKKLDNRTVMDPDAKLAGSVQSYAVARATLHFDIDPEVEDGFAMHFAKCNYDRPFGMLGKLNKWVEPAADGLREQKVARIEWLGPTDFKHARDYATYLRRKEAEKRNPPSKRSRAKDAIFEAFQENESLTREELNKYRPEDIGVTTWKEAKSEFHFEEVGDGKVCLAAEQDF